MDLERWSILYLAFHPIRRMIVKHALFFEGLLFAGLRTRQIIRMQR